MKFGTLPRHCQRHYRFALYRCAGHHRRKPIEPNCRYPHAGTDRAQCARNLKATFFAVMFSFTNIELSAFALETKYLFLVTHEVTDRRLAQFCFGLITTNLASR